MDKHSTIIMLGIILAVIFPFIIFRFIQKHKIRRFHDRFHRLAGEERLQVTHKEVWNRKYAIAIDSISRKLLYVRKEDTEVSSRLVDLAKVEGTKIRKTDILDEDSNGRRPDAYRLDLVLSQRNGSASEILLEFYHNPSFMPSQDDLVHVQKWSSLINQHLGR